MSLEIFDTETQPGQPDAIADLIGLKVTRAWIIKSVQTFMLQFEGGRILCIEPVRAIGMGALALKSGTEIEGADWSDIDKLPRDPQLDALCGMAFTGFDKNVVMFGDFGAKITNKGLEWVRAA